jgi:mannosyl-3-phosphoglycerate phosphatase family protein
MHERTALSRRLIIITDLDGTLLDALTYSFQEAGPALELIRQRDIPLVICSSKTRAEIEVYRRRLDNGHQLIALGSPYEEIRKRFLAMRDRLGTAVRGFGDMTIEEVADLTGLTPEEANLAKQRDFAEPFIFSGAPDDRFLREIEGEKLRWTQGRFFHIMGDHHKGRAVTMLRRLYEQTGGPVLTIGIGDSLNDLPFLLAVDRPVLVKKVSGKHDGRINIPDLVRTEGIGPAGWNEAVLEMLT